MTSSDGALPSGTTGMRLGSSLMTSVGGEPIAGDDDAAAAVAAAAGGAASPAGDESEISIACVPAAGVPMSTATSEPDDGSGVAGCPVGESRKLEGLLRSLPERVWGACSRTSVAPNLTCLRAAVAGAAGGGACAAEAALAAAAAAAAAAVSSRWRSCCRLGGGALVALVVVEVAAVAAAAAVAVAV